MSSWVFEHPLQSNKKVKTRAKCAPLSPCHCAWWQHARVQRLVHLSFWEPSDKGGQLEHSKTAIVQRTEDRNIWNQYTLKNESAVHYIPIIILFCSCVSQKIVMAVEKHVFTDSLPPGILFCCIYFTAFSSKTMCNIFL